MAAYQYVYHMQGVSKTYPGGKKCFENIHLSFLPGVKIGVVGVNGAGKSTLMRIMAGLGQIYKRDWRTTLYGSFTNTLFPDTFVPVTSPFMLISISEYCGSIIIVPSMAMTPHWL